MDTPTSSNNPTPLPVSEESTPNVSVKEKYQTLGRAAATTIKLRPSDGTADVTIGVTKPKVPVDLRNIGSSSPGRVDKYLKIFGFRGSLNFKDSG